MKGNSKCPSSDLLSPERVHNKDFGAAMQMLLIKVKLRLQGRLVKLLIVTFSLCDSHQNIQSELFIYDLYMCSKKNCGDSNVLNLRNPGCLVYDFLIKNLGFPRCPTTKVRTQGPAVSSRTYPWSSVDDLKLWILIRLVNWILILLVVHQFNHDVMDCKYSPVYFDLSFVLQS